MSDTSRRKLLKSIAAGSGAIVAGKALPESWSRPVVDSVVLPVHARTSGVCPTLILEVATSANCSDALSLNIQLFFVDDSGTCPVVRNDTGETTGTGAPSQIFVSTQRTATRARVNFEIRNTVNESTLQTDQDCDEPVGISTDIFSMIFETTSGAIWTATGSITRGSDSVSISDILLAPLT